MVERDGDMMTKVLPDTTRNTIHPLVEMNVQAGTVLSTDEFGAYIGLSKKGYIHNTVKPFSGGVGAWMTRTSTRPKASGPTLRTACAAPIRRFHQNT